MNKLQQNIVWNNFRELSLNSRYYLITDFKQNTILLICLNKPPVYIKTYTKAIKT